jgi:hypothetical protein
MGAGPPRWPRWTPCSMRSARVPWPTGGIACAHQTVSMQRAADAHSQLESGTVHEPIIVALN